MPFVAGKDNRGQRFRVDWEQVSNIVGAHAYLRAFVAHAREGKESNMLGSVKTVNFDHAKVRESKRMFINATMPMVVQTVHRDFQKGQQVLVSLRAQTLQYRKRRDEMFAVAEASGKSFDWWADKAVGTAQLVRDTGFATVAVIAAPVGGAWAIGATAFSAAGAGIGKYQDTGNVGSALVSGAGSLIMAGWGAVTNAAKVAGAAKGVLIGMGCVFDSSLEMIGSVVEGKNGRDVAKAGIIKLITGGLGVGLDHASSQKVDAVWKETMQLMDTIGWKDAAFRLSLEAAKKGTDKVGGYAGDQISLDAAQTQVNTQYIKHSVLMGG